MKTFTPSPADGRTVASEPPSVATARASDPPVIAEAQRTAFHDIGRRLVDGPIAAAKAGCSYRHWLRLADSGKAPPGIKLGALRRWDLDELDRWIANGCPRVRTARGATR